MSLISNRKSVVTYAAIFLVDALLALATIWWTTQAADVAEAWFANALLVALVLRGVLISFRATLAIGFLAIALAKWLTGASLLVALGFGVASAAEVAAAVLLVRGFGLRLSDDLDDRAFLLGLVATIVWAPAVGGMLGATVISLTSSVIWIQTFIAWWLRDAVGMLILLPPLLSFTPNRMRSLLFGRRARVFWIALPLSIAVTVLATLFLKRPFIVWSIPLLFAAYRLGVFGTMLACSINIALLFALAVAQRWGFTAAGIAGLQEDEIAFFAVVSIVGPMLMSLVINQRERQAGNFAEVSNRLQVVADNVPALIGQLDADRRFVFVNRAYLKWHGKTLADVIGKFVDDVLDAETLKQVAPNIERVLAGESLTFETVMPTGQRLEENYAPHWRGGRIDGFFVLARDVTERSELEIRMRDITDNVPVLIAYLDNHLVYRFANQRYVDTWGHHPGGVVGRTSSEVTGKRYTDMLRPQQVECLTGRRVTLEFRHDNGRVFDMTYVPHTVNGEVRGLYKLGVDITDRKQAEAQLFETVDRAQRMLDSIGDAVIACDEHLHVTLMNPIAVEMTGWSEEEALGRPLGDILQLIDPDTGLTPMSPLEVAIKDDRIVALQSNCVLRNRRGIESPIEDSASPIHDRDGRVSGGIMVFHDVSESRAMALKMSHLAQHDYLTDLPNRVLLQDRLAQALTVLRPPMEGALMYIDLDHFKNINDSLGHQAGDHVLQEVAHRLQRETRSYDTVSRQGGDEFVVLLSRLETSRDAARVAAKIIASIEREIQFEDHVLHVSASVGIAAFPGDSTDSKTLMKQADTALYHAKQAGRGRFSFFSEKMSQRADHRLALEQALRQALLRGELFLVYQPRVRWPERELIGVEALVRWRRPDGVVVGPDNFIELAEEAGLITELDEWVLREVCRQIAAWLKAGYKKIPISANVSLVRLDTERFLRSVQSAIDATGIPCDSLEIEFTESQMFTQREQALALLSSLKRIGVGLTIDDFGTGYSNLSYVSQYEFDTLKIDRSFVHGLPAHKKQYAILQAIIGMARALGYHMLAEGVEVEEEATTLVFNGCHDMQGYLFSPPVSAEECAAFFDDPARLFARLTPNRSPIELVNLTET